MRPADRNPSASQRLQEHAARGTTDSAESVVRLPVSYYLDPVLWRCEMGHIFERLPLLLSFAAELHGPVSGGAQRFRCSVPGQGVM